MFVIDQSERDFRFGDSGPKYLMKGPRSNFALVRFNPGEDFPAHYHNIMEENFYILEGQVDVHVDDQVHHLYPGQLIHIEPKQVHYVNNPYEKPVLMISTLAPYQEVDKVDVPDYKVRS